MAEKEVKKIKKHPKVTRTYALDKEVADYIDSYIAEEAKKGINPSASAFANNLLKIGIKWHRVKKEAGF